MIGNLVLDAQTAKPTIGQVQSDLFTKPSLELDPLNPFVRGLHGVQLFMADDLKGSIRVTEDVLASTPGFGFGYWTLIHAYHYLGEKDKAIAAAAKEHRIFVDSEADKYSQPSE